MSKLKTRNSFHGQMQYISNLYCGGMIFSVAFGENILRGDIEQWKTPRSPKQAEESIHNFQQGRRRHINESRSQRKHQVTDTRTTLMYIDLMQQRIEISSCWFLCLLICFSCHFTLLWKFHRNWFSKDIIIQRDSNIQQRGRDANALAIPCQLIFYDPLLTINSI